MTERPNMVRETLAALIVGAVMLVGYAAVSSLPRGTNLQLAIVVVSALLTLTVSVALWRYLVRPRRKD